MWLVRVQPPPWCEGRQWNGASALSIVAAPALPLY